MQRADIFESEILYFLFEFLLYSLEGNRPNCGGSPVAI
jgi:hypothetical protein